MVKKCISRSVSDEKEDLSCINRIGVLGGTFDPVHYAHIALGEAAIKEAGLRKLIVMPARVQPFKQDKKTAEDIHRKAMTRLAFIGNDKIGVSDYEMEDPSLSYTIKTLTYLRQQYPGDEIYFISGTDSFLEIDKWYRGGEILENFSFAVSVSPGYREEELREKILEYGRKYGCPVIRINAQMPAISSTMVRQRIGAGDSVEDLVPPQVERYITANELYK